MSRQARAELLILSGKLEDLIAEAEYQAEYLHKAGTKRFVLDHACNGLDSLLNDFRNLPLPTTAKCSLSVARIMAQLHGRLCGLYNAVLRSPETGKPISLLADEFDNDIKIMATLASMVENEMVASIPR